MVDVWNAILGGALAGIVIAILVGPVFFALLQTSIEKGFLLGVLFALGIVTSDATYFLLSYFGLSQFGASHSVHFIMGLAGGTFLIGFGIQLATKKVRMGSGQPVELKKNSMVRSLAKGFLINSLNPGALLYWLGVVSAANAQFESNHKKIFAFFITTMCIVFSTDILKAYLAFRLKNVITAKFMVWLNRISGSILVIAGGKLLVEALLPYLHFS